MKLYDRIVDYAKKNKLPLQPIEKRMELGKIVMEAYHTSGIKQNFSYVNSVENGSTFRVASYPGIFAPKMDEIIADFYQKNPVEQRPKRPRIKRPYRSFKPSFTPQNQ